jgi:serine/threonine protein kinase
MANLASISSTSFIGYVPPEVVPIVEEPVKIDAKIAVAPLFASVINRDTIKSNRQELLGKGAFGEVYGGFYEDRPIAVKFIDLQKQNSNVKAQNLALCSVLREIMTHVYCQHPAILSLVGWNFVTDYQSPFVLITDKMANGALKERKIKMLTPTEKMIIMYGSARGLEYMHSRHIMHRDIKPENIFLDDQNRPRIGDLGMAKMTSEDGMTYKMGSPLWMAPEILDKRCGVWGYPADVYAFGISCFQIAVGKMIWPPAGIRNNTMLTRRIIEGLRPDRKQLANTGFGQLLERMWDRNPSARPTFQEVAEELLNPTNWLSGVNAQEFTEYTNWLKNQQICLPPAGLGVCLARVKLATRIGDQIPQELSLVERFAITLSLICSDERDDQEEIKQFVLTQLNENKSLKHIEVMDVSEALIPDTEVEENRELVNFQEVEDEEEEVLEQEWVQPEGENYHLRVRRNGEWFTIEIPLPVEATVTNLYETLEAVVGQPVTIRTISRSFAKDSNQVLTELNLKDLLLDVVVASELKDE